MLLLRLVMIILSPENDFTSKNANSTRKRRHPQAQSSHPQAQARMRRALGAALARGGAGATETVFVALEIGFRAPQIDLRGAGNEFQSTTDKRHCHLSPRLNNPLGLDLGAVLIPGTQPSSANSPRHPWVMQIHTTAQSAGAAP